MFVEIDSVFKYLNYKPSKEVYMDSLDFFSDVRKDVRIALDKLSWDESPSNQRKAIKFLKSNLKPSEYIFLVFPDRYIKFEKDNCIFFVKQYSDKSRWENAAKLITKIGWPKTDIIIIPLFLWLLDNNWPGSNLIYSFLLSLPKEILIAKMNEIISSSEKYSACDYKDLVGIIEDIKWQLKTKTGDGSMSSPD